MTMTTGAGRRTTAPRSNPAPTSAAPGLPPAPIVALPKARRRPALLALGVGLMSLGILGGAWLVQGAGNQQDVLAVARAVPFGAVITSQDLTRTKISHDPAVATVPTTELGQMVGRVAAPPLRAMALRPPQRPLGCHRRRSWRCPKPAGGRHCWRLASA